MPRLLACNACHILQRAPDVHPKTPLVPARMVWEDGTEYIYRDDEGHAKMVPAYDPILEAFVEAHQHDRPDVEVLEGNVIRVWVVDQATWDSMDIVTKVKKEMEAETGQWYEDRDTYREGAIACYNEHGNPDTSSGCRDFMSDSKQIGTVRHKADDGQVVTIPPKFRQYLCYQCPYFHAYVQVDIRKKAGAYT